MLQSTESLEKEVDNLYKKKKFKDIIKILPESILIGCKNANLFAFRALSHDKLGQSGLTKYYANAAIDLDTNLYKAYYARGNSYLDTNEIPNAIRDFNKAIELEPNHILSYNNRSLCFRRLKDYIKALEDIDMAIKLDPKISILYNNKGLVFASQKQYDLAINEFIHATHLDKKFSAAYNNHGNTLAQQKKYPEAIEKYSTALDINPSSANTYFNRAKAFKEIRDHENTKKDLEEFIAINNNPNDRVYLYSLTELKEVDLKIQYKWYDEIDSVINEIKSLLLFEDLCVTHYTSLTATKAMILQKSPFRLSEGAFLNDTSEGRELFSFLNFNNSKNKDNNTVYTSFVEKPFVGSFVEEKKHNDLTLWRMYGKEALSEAKGCALTINREKFIESIEDVIIALNNEKIYPRELGQEPAFYRIAYLINDKFVIPGDNGSKNESRLNDSMNMLKEMVISLNQPQQDLIYQILTNIAYFFKSGEYQYEHEVRLVVPSTIMKKKFDMNLSPPRVYVELCEITPLLEQITLGPKVERADEWASAFNYFIEDQLLNVKIIMSHLPFK
ncbi:tetratricopeptide repeat protein [Pedobacter sp. AW31-3R]|uniref:tetratricopeptide repeat protein n=1 Tax=Pedobacter sp. AW31-3R TaxID=3445781 RepID=UPI003F9F97B7